MKRLPIGYDNFEKMQMENNYYIDKTGFIKELLVNRGEVTLFTRPRRFGKTLAMSMLQSFFSLDSDPLLFEGLEISREKELCEQYQGKYPVIFLSLKDMEGSSFEEAAAQLADFISGKCDKLSFLLNSEKVSKRDKGILEKLLFKKADHAELKASLSSLMKMLHDHFEKKVILLIDEYDVPLDKAYHSGYYDEMVRFLRIFLGKALKTNEDLEFAVLTGCLRVSQESIFTGLNNFKVDTISDTRFAGYFGFTDSEVKYLLADYQVSDAYGRVKEWYDGYRFGREGMYCPWDVLNYVDKLLDNPQAKPQSFWRNTSSNDIIRELLRIADKSVKGKIEALIEGGSVTASVSENLTYSELREDPEHLWSMLYLTGYLTLAKECEDSSFVQLVIPNKEIRELFVDQIEKWLRQSIYPSHHAVTLKYLFEHKPEELQQYLNQVLIRTISFYDYKEDFYHAFLVGLLIGGDRYDVRSNRENGAGRSDITVTDLLGNDVVVIEVKNSKSRRELAENCKKALKQIEEKRYADPFLEEGYDVWKYGISFFQKECCVLLDGFSEK